ncbi:hypothetical protein RAS1_11480 [Phycisphaerae bacterium RAS1]|nr:hypothetical protein RAS1_11480 [Phycisphaerae bacterium RAS1]
MGTMSTSADFFLNQASGTVMRSGAASEDSLSEPANRAAEWRAAWNELIDKKLIEWGRQTEALADEDLIPPTATAILASSTLVQRLRDRQSAPPCRCVPDRDGGVVIEWWSQQTSIALEISSSGAVELVFMENGKVKGRAPVSL